MGFVYSFIMTKNSFIFTLLAIALVACSKKETTTPNSTDDKNMIVLKSVEFVPSTLTVKVGEKVTWKNIENTKHNVQAPDSSYFSKDLLNGDTYQHTYSVAGTYPYECFYHKVHMKGNIIIQ